MAIIQGLNFPKSRFHNILIARYWNPAKNVYTHYIFRFYDLLTKSIYLLQADSNTKVIKKGKLSINLYLIITKFVINQNQLINITMFDIQNVLKCKRSLVRSLLQQFYFNFVNQYKIPLLIVLLMQYGDVLVSM